MMRKSGGGRPDEAEQVGRRRAPTGELAVIDAPRRRRAGTGAGAAHRENRSRAAQRAVNRRASRLAKESRESTASGGRTRTQPGAVRPSLVERVRTMPFAVPVIALVALGLVGTLWLSTRAAQDSYELTMAKAQNQSLVDKRDALKRTYESADSAPELSDKAARLGLIPARNSARLVVGENGRIVVRGTPTPASGRAPHSINPKPVDEALRHIDTSKVEDSTGLPGADQGQAAQPEQQGQNQQGQNQQGQNEQQSPTQQSGQPQDGSRTDTPAPTEAAPNVLPQTGSRGAPGANARRNS